MEIRVWRYAQVCELSMGPLCCAGQFSALTDGRASFHAWMWSAAVMVVMACSSPFSLFVCMASLAIGWITSPLSSGGDWSNPWFDYTLTQFYCALTHTTCGYRSSLWITKWLWFCMGTVFASRAPGLFPGLVHAAMWLLLP